MPEPQGRATLDAMSATSTAPAPTAVRGPSIRANDATSPIDAARALGVILGGPVVLLGGLSTAAIHAVRAVRRGRLPRPAAVAAFGAAAAYTAYALLLERAHFVMERKMLFEIKRRAHCAA